MDIHNIRVVKCRKCSGSISPGVGFKFIAERFGADPSGFLCKGCVGKEMIDVKEWHYNQITGTLFPAQYFTINPVSGDELALAWEGRGEAGVNELLLRNLGR